MPREDVEKLSEEDLRELFFAPGKETHIKTMCRQVGEIIEIYTSSPECNGMYVFNGLVPADRNYQLMQR